MPEFMDLLDDTRAWCAECRSWYEKPSVGRNTYCKCEGAHIVVGHG